MNDLAFTEYLDTAGPAPRDSAELRKPKDGGAIVIEGKIAVLRLNACNHPNTMPGVTPSPVKTRAGRLSRQLASLRNDLRIKILFRDLQLMPLACPPLPSNIVTEIDMIRVRRFAFI